jgi:hypothetical protein
VDPYRFYIPSSFSIEKYETEVSHVFRWFLRWFLSSVCVCVWTDEEKLSYTVILLIYFMLFSVHSLECLHLTVRSQLTPTFRGMFFSCR